MHDVLLAALAEPRLKELRDLAGAAHAPRPDRRRRAGRRRRVGLGRRVVGSGDQSGAIVLPERRPAA
jgi:hypothetical protein